MGCVSVLEVKRSAQAVSCPQEALNERLQGNTGVHLQQPAMSGASAPAAAQRTWSALCPTLNSPAATRICSSAKPIQKAPCAKGSGRARAAVKLCQVCPR